MDNSSHPSFNWNIYTQTQVIKLNKIINYKNKNIGILGLGMSGLAAAKVLLNSNANIFAFDDKKEKPSILTKSMWMNYQNWPWEKLTSLIVSPGIPINSENKHKAIKLALEHNVKILNDIDLFFETKPKAKVIGITGTNGKSTTVALLYHILKHNEIKCVIGGNYGFPACEINDPGDDGIIVLELSSYQLDGVTKLNLHSASIINLTPDHLDYHGSFEKYKSCKLKILSFLNYKSIVVLDSKNNLLKELINKEKYKGIKIVETKSINYKYFIKGNSFLEGDHNKVNASIAISLARNLDINNEKIKLSIKSFYGLPHRMEPLYTSEKIRIVNDSKSTNGEATAAALSTFKNVFWIVGGQPKLDGIGKAKNYLDRVVEGFLIGNSTDFFINEILKYDQKIPLNKCKTLEKATMLAIKKVKTSNLKNSVILLSPSAASFDQFKNFEDRGDQFKKIISAQLKEGVFACL